MKALQKGRGRGESLLTSRQTALSIELFEGPLLGAVKKGRAFLPLLQKSILETLDCLMQAKGKFQASSLK